MITYEDLFIYSFIFKVALHVDKQQMLINARTIYYNELKERRNTGGSETTKKTWKYMSVIMPKKLVSNSNTWIQFRINSDIQLNQSLTITKISSSVLHFQKNKKTIEMG